MKSIFIYIKYIVVLVVIILVMLIIAVQPCKIMNGTDANVYGVCCRCITDSEFFPLNN